MGGARQGCCEHARGAERCPRIDPPSTRRHSKLPPAAGVCRRKRPRGKAGEGLPRAPGGVPSVAPSAAPLGAATTQQHSKWTRPRSTHPFFPGAGPAYGGQRKNFNGFFFRLPVCPLTRREGSGGALAARAISQAPYCHAPSFTIRRQIVRKGKKTREKKQHKNSANIGANPYILCATVKIAACLYRSFSIERSQCAAAAQHEWRRRGDLGTAQHGGTRTRTGVERLRDFATRLQAASKQ